MTTVPSVVLANEPRAYRDTLAVALRMLRPDADVIVIEPDALDDAVQRRTPQVVICSKLTAVIENQVPVWVVLYPEGVQASLRCVNGRRETIGEVDLAVIVSLLDQNGGCIQA